MASQLLSKLDEWFAIDLRSLATFRVALASVFLFDLGGRASDLRAHYTDAGVLPTILLEQVAGSGILFSLHYHLSQFEWAVVALFVMAGLSGIALLLGYRTRLATFACWFLLASAQVRNPFLNIMGGDNLLNVLFTWSLLLPLGKCWSVDRLRDRTPPIASMRLRSIPAAALLLQVCLVYWVTGLKKSGTTWLDGSAVYYALHLDYWVTSFGAALREQERLLPFFTHASRWFELLGPFLAFSPVFTQSLRMLTIALFAGFHLVLALSFDIGMFPLVSMVGWFAFLPTCFWEWLRGFGIDEGERGGRRGEGIAPPTVRARWYEEFAGLALLIYVVALLSISVGWLHVKIPGPVSRLASALRVQQSWAMFAPDPSFDDVWPVVIGTMQSGQAIDLFRGSPPGFEKPENVAATLPGFRWRLYFKTLMGIDPASPRFGPAHKGLARYLCREWNASHAGERRLREIQIALVFERTLEAGEAAPIGIERYRISCHEAEKR